MTQLSICDVCSVGQDTTWDERKQLHVCRSCLHAEGAIPGVAAPATDWEKRFHRAQRLAISLDEQRRTAVAECDELRARNRVQADQLSEERQAADAEIARLNHDAAAWEKAHREAEAEADRLREALTDIAEPLVPSTDRRDIARAALAKEPS